MRVADWIFNWHRPNGEVADTGKLFRVRSVVRISTANLADCLGANEEINFSPECIGVNLKKISEFLAGHYRIEGLLLASAQDPFPTLPDFDPEIELIRCVRSGDTDEEQAEKFVKSLLGCLQGTLETMDEIRTAVATDDFGFWRMSDIGIAYFTRKKLDNLPKGIGLVPNCIEGF